MERRFITEDEVLSGEIEGLAVVSADGEVRTLVEFARVDEPLGEPTHAGMAVQAADTGRLLMIQRSLDPEDPAEVQGTWEFPGGGIEDGESPEAAAWREFSEETGLPQPVGEVVDGWRSDNGIYQGFLFSTPVEAEAFPELNPDDEAAHTDNPDDPGRRNPDVTAWFTVDQLKGLGAALRPEVAAMDWSIFGQQEDDMTEMQDETASAPVDDVAPVPWFGVLAPEGVPSGDKRMFGVDSLRMRPLPLPLTWQKVGAPGHDGHVTVATIENVWRQFGKIWGSGHFLQTPEADEAMNLVASFGRYGVSIDADDLDEFSIQMHDDGTAEFTDARACSACLVSIPAFAEAWVMLGEFSEEYAAGWGAPSQQIPTVGEQPAEDEGPDCEKDENGNCIEKEPDEDDALAASAAFADMAPGKTEDGPGWLTHPVDTDRLRDYWVRGEGAAKIAWGTPGDFNRCRVNLAKYVKPQYLSGYCANRHYDALGFWPGEHNQGNGMMFQTTTTTSTGPAIGGQGSQSVITYETRRQELPGVLDVEIDDTPSLTAAGGPRADLDGTWFDNPGLSRPTALTVTDEGRVFGHLATWGMCHIGFQKPGECVETPHSATDYAYFRTGMIQTSTGPVFVGNITMGGGHASDRLGWRAAADHYDSTSAVVADVAVGEDEHGVWFAGAMRPHVTPEQVAELQASGGLSGDWREVVRGSQQLELVAALAVNVGGFPVPRIAAHVSEGKVLSLVAAGYVERDPIDDVADAVIARIEERAEVKSRLESLREKVVGERLAALREKF